MNGNFVLMGWTIMSGEEADEILSKIEGMYSKTQRISSKKETQSDTKRPASFFAFFDDLPSTELHVKSMLPVFTIVVLVDLVKDKAFIYKGPNMEEIKTIYLPKLFSLYEQSGMGIYPCLQSIEDLRMLYSNIPRNPFVN